MFCARQPSFIVAEVMKVSNKKSKSNYTIHIIVSVCLFFFHPRSFVVSRQSLIEI